MIAVAGNINADLNFQVPRLPHGGETLLAAEMSLGAGGKASNQSVALRRLGGEPLLLGSVGADALGDMVLARLGAEGVATDAVARVQGAVTGTASVMSVPGGDNAIVTALGANLADRLAPDLSGCGALLMTLGLPEPFLLALLDDAAALGLSVVVDATPLRDRRPAPKLLAVDVLSANRGEAEQLTGRAIADSDAAVTAARDLLEAGAGAAVVKLGEDGAAWATADDAGVVPAPKVDAVDTTGAGDAFMAGLTLRLVAGEPLPRAVAFGCAVGAAATRARGAQGQWSAADVMRLWEDRA